MPIKIPNDLPARTTLENEGVMVMTEDDAIRQDVRPLRIALLNLMPNKERTETQFARLVGATPLQVELSLMSLSSHTPKNTPTEHMLTFYRPWEALREEKFDGFIITGAPVELLDFESVTYWRELTRIFEWTQTNVHSMFAICWGAQAALWHFHRVPKYELKEKAFGVFRHKNLKPSSPYLRGFSDDFAVPVSRWTENRREDLPKNAGIEVLMESDETGLCLVHDGPRRALYMFNHLEYDSRSLGDEYWRDRNAGKPINLPRNYYPGDDPTAVPENRWRSHAHLLFGNWINEVYQTTPFNVEEIGRTNSAPAGEPVRRAS
ncbi:homoserine O-acetyltransferase MetA [Rhodoligotrophos defluvii]|uniref:homoserine O-acetyltransferase MetA n=1 Tax=Rhodoligotrophos defluvii TaxID=2561934 RepID=UPI0010C9AACC|nr:homoserine O-succinyltransferase [Rhodoligotrophos defluvii]